MKRLFQVFMLAVILVGALGTWMSLSLPSWSNQSRNLSAPAEVQLGRGTKLADLAEELEADGVIDSAVRFRLWVRVHGDYGRFQAGRYRFESAVTPAQVVDAFVQGRTYKPFELQFVIPEGFTLKQVVERLAVRNVGTREELWAVAHDKTLLEKYKIEGPDVEGYLFPATYSFELMPKPRQVFERMLQTFFQNLPAGMLEALATRQLSLQKAVIFASLIEKETMHDAEMPMISEVIWNRLKSGETLGIDAALIYGIEDYKGDITWKHLRDRTNPYNTRIHRGLPPGPIGAISMKALQAVLTPTQEGYHFYVLRNDGSSYHNFSRTLVEHNRYVKQLIQSSPK